MNTNQNSLSIDQVYLGFWTNWAHGRVSGATITLTRGNGDLLIAFLALFTAWVGRSYWRITCFCIHGFLSSSSPQDGLYHQRQVILRNSSTALECIYGSMQALWAWRNRARHSYIRLLPLVIFAACSSAAFSVAGIFSSHVANPVGNEVLISSPNCGSVFNSSVSQNVDSYLSYVVPYIVQRTLKASNYALQCYADSISASDCSTYVKSSLPRTINRNASCPFEESICASKSGNLLIDTGYLDSFSQLGVNTKPEYQFQYRYRYHCAPLSTDGYTRNFDETNSSVTQPVVRYYYGTPKGAKGNSTYTYQYPSNTIVTLDPYTKGPTAIVDYSIGVLTAYASPDSYGLSAFKPVAPLVRNDADVSVLFLSSNGVRFKQPTDDPWFSAHKPGAQALVTPNATAGNTSAADVFYGDMPAQVLGCARQFQYCNPSLPESSRCTPLGTAAPNMSRIAELWTTDAERHLIQAVVSRISSQTFVEEVIKYLGTSALTARSKLMTGLQGPLPVNQWQTEIEHWHAVSSATLQGSMVEVALGPKDQALLSFLNKPVSETDKYLCANQKILSTNFASFSVLGLGILLGLGAIIILISYTLETIIGLVQQRFGTHKYGLLEWKINATSQLQRLAHEALGFGTWSKAADAFPVTEKGELLASIDMENSLHPVLRAEPDQTKRNIMYNEQSSATGVSVTEQEQTLYHL